MVERNRKVAVAPFEAAVHEPANNIFIRAHDTVYSYREPETFLAFGAAGRQGQIPYDA
jgi:polysaccharide biosynthesis/export protein